MWGLFALCVIVGALALWVPGYLLLRAARVARMVAFCCAPALALAIYGVMCVVYDKLGLFADFMSMVLPLACATAVAWVALSVVRMGRSRSCERAAAASSLVAPELANNAEGGAAMPEGARAESRAGRRTADLSGDGPLSFELSAEGIPAFLRGHFGLKAVLLFMAVGLLVASVFFGCTLRSPVDYVQGFDNMHHLGMVRTFAESGCWSPLDVAAYPPEVRATTMPTVGWSFYPTMLYCVAAMMVSLLGVPVTLALNAANFLFLGLVFPASMVMLLGFLFRDNARALLAGSLLSFAFATFPWQFMNWGPLYPNLASFAVLPAVAFLFLAVFAQGARRKDRVAAGTLFTAGLVALVLTQTNAVFTLAVFLIPFCVSQAMRIPAYVGNRTSTPLKRLVAGAIAFAAIAAFWFFLFRLPFLSGVVGYVWQPYTSLQGALGNVLLLSFRSTGAQVVLGALVVVGAFCAVRDRRYRWVLVAYVLMCGIYVIASIENSFLKQLLAGFWYTDAMRLGASAAFYAVPLACLGLVRVFSAAAHAAKHLGAGARGAHAAATVGVLAVALLVAVGFAPVKALADDEAPVDKPKREFFGFESPQREYISAFDDLMRSTRRQTNPEAENVYDAAESAFVRRAAEVAGSDLVINMPEDGSVFSYAVDGLNTYYRYARAVGGEDEPEESRAIRTGLRNYAADERVREAVQTIGAKYVLMLDQGDAGRRESHYFFSYEERQWAGIDAVRDSTPGFEVVLAEGDMRLYRIV